MSILCPSCRTELPDAATFCSSCGAQVNPAQPKNVDPQEILRNAAPKAGGKDDQEQELWQGGYSAKAMIGSWLAAVAVTIGILLLAFFLAFTGIAVLIAGIVIAVLWTIMFAMYAYQRLSVRYTLTSQRFVHERGILSRQTDRVEVIDVDDVSFRQGLIERMLNVGTIELVSSDRTDPNLKLRGIDDVKRVADMIDEARRVERRKRGLHIEQV